MAITPTRFVEIEGVNLSFIVALTHAHHVLHSF